ncbi:MAG: aldehyde dehydrogenase family protein, partial [Candidatus Dormibacteraeota bacterium]|nr:aldehyde dehydrogenase family protein [Candidatus Dormibacteraeota bacterium]
MATTVARFTSVNPATEEEIESFDVADERRIDDALQVAQQAGRDWRAHPIAERVALLRAAGDVLRRSADSHAATITQEMGKPLADGKAEVEKCAFVCEYFAEHAPRFLADEPAPSDSPASFVTFDPLGVLLACMP